jgi:hypothetical protein
MEHWRHTAEKYKELWNLLNYIESLDGIHVNVQCPIIAGSAFYKDKGSNSRVVFLLVDANCKFDIIDIGSYRRNSDGNIFTKTSLGKLLQN